MTEIRWTRQTSANVRASRRDVMKRSRPLFRRRCRIGSPALRGGTGLLPSTHTRSATESQAITSCAYAHLDVSRGLGLVPSARHGRFGQGNVSSRPRSCETRPFRTRRQGIGSTAWLRFCSPGARSYDRRDFLRISSDDVGWVSHVPRHVVAAYGIPEVTRWGMVPAPDLSPESSSRGRG